jgi:hypothetical protein
VLPTASRPPELQPLAELPSLVVADPARDVRGWEIRSASGEALGVVSELLADADRLIVEYLVVSSPGRGTSYVSLAAVSAGPGHLIAGAGALPPIQLRYRSTTSLTARTAAVAAAIVALVWLLQVFAC